MPPTFGEILLQLVLWVFGIAGVLLIGFGAYEALLKLKEWWDESS